MPVSCYEGASEATLCTRTGIAQWLCDLSVCPIKYGYINFRIGRFQLYLLDDGQFMAFQAS